MKKRNKASSSASRRARGGHIPATKRSAGAARVKPVKRTQPPRPLAAAPQAPPESAPQIDASPPSTLLSLPAECTVSGASSLKEQLATLLDEPRSVTLDVTALQRIDTAALQVITAFVRERTGHSRAVEWQGSAQVLATAAQLLGLNSALKLPS